MPGQKQPISINISQGLDLKTDPYQVGAGKFLSLVNSIFDTLGRLTKRNGNEALATLPEPATYLTTFNGDLTAVGTTLQAYNSGSESWVNKGNVQPCTLSVLPLIRNSVNQNQCDTAISANGLVCTVYTETNGTNTFYKYAIADSTTGQNIVAPSVLVGSAGTVSGNPRVFILSQLFVIVYTVTISGAKHLQYIAVSSLNPSVPTAPNDITTSYISASTLSWDGVVANNTLYVAYNSTGGGQAVKITSLSAAQAAGGGTAQAPLVFSGSVATAMSVSADNTNPQSPIIYACFFNAGDATGHAVSCDKNLNPIMTATQWSSSTAINNVTSVASGGVLDVYFEVSNQYAFDTSINSNLISSIDVTAPAVSGAGSAGSSFTVLRGAGLASKAFIVNGITYFLSAYSSPYQPTYFLVNGSLSLAAAPVIVAKLAYQNGGGYLTQGLPSVTVTGTTAQFAYLFKDLVLAESATNITTAGAQAIGVYTQTGINLASITFGTQGLDSAEIGGNLNLTGGFLWNYDGYTPVEQNFFIYPELDATQDVGGGGGWATVTTGGNMIAQIYYYVAVYEWYDNQGLSYKSVPSIPILVNLSSSMTATNQVTVRVPTYRQTYKVANPAKITLYRWSEAQQTYYQTTSITTPLLNNTTIDYVSFVDLNSDTTILGNEILYTTGGVLENVNPPASSLVTLFDNRLWLVDAEDPNTLWFSQSVVESEPVQMSDLSTYYVAPAEASQGPTGPVTAIFPMDDKLIIFKSNSIFFINGTGPNSLGTNSTYPNTPFLVAGTVGCSNQNSIVFTNDGLMFQSSKGIWLLSRSMQVQYIGAPVEAYNSITVNSAINVPGTNRVEFTLANGITIFYDYFVSQWGTFQGAPAIASTIYQNLPTHINSAGIAFQETPGLYMDLGIPVLQSLQSGWINLAGLTGYQRAYYFYLLGTFISPHKLQVSFAYDFNSAYSQQVTINPNLYNPPWGGNPTWGQDSLWGGGVNPTWSASLEEFKIHLARQTCQTIQITIQELFDTTFGTVAGAGLTLTGFSCIAMFKKGYRPIGPNRSIG